MTRGNVAMRVREPIRDMMRAIARITPKLSMVVVVVKLPVVAGTAGSVIAE